MTSRARLPFPLAAGCAGDPPAGGDSGVGGPQASRASLARRSPSWRPSPLPPLPPDPTNAWADDADAAWFGRYLFYEPRLSGPGTFSCATCHDPAQGWGDGLRLSEAAGTTTRHAPTLWNVGHQRWFYWDGRCDSLWCQAISPIEAEAEMAGSRLQVAHTLHDDPALRDAYAALFGPHPDLSDGDRFPNAGRPVPDDPTHPHAVAWASMAPADQDAVTEVMVHVAKAIGAFERTIQTGESRVDRYVAAFVDRDEAAMAALSAEEEEGLRHFVSDGNCFFCHAGPLGSNREFASAGLGHRDWLPLEDLGRYGGIDGLRAAEFNAASAWSDDPTGEAANRIDRLNQSSEQLGLFGAGPAQRRDSPPYMHGGHLKTLDVVGHYNRLDEEIIVGHLDTFMVPLEWTEADIASVVAFLEAWSAEPPTHRCSRPRTRPCRADRRAAGTAARLPAAPRADATRACPATRGAPVVAEVVAGQQAEPDGEVDGAGVVGVGVAALRHPMGEVGPEAEELDGGGGLGAAEEQQVLQRQAQPVVPPEDQRRMMICRTRRCRMKVRNQATKVRPSKSVGAGAGVVVGVVQQLPKRKAAYSAALRAPRRFNRGRDELTVPCMASCAVMKRPVKSHV